MTHRLDRENAYEQQMTATIQTRLVHDGRPAVILERSIFYPTSGGQSADHGTLWPTEDTADASSVLDVVLEGDAVIHVLDRPLPEKATTVGGRIHWARRFEHMQQHTGQHMLSAALHNLLSAATVSSRLGAEHDTIDLAKEFSLPALKEAEELANQVISDNRPVRVLLPSEEALSSMKLRREPKVESNIRVIDIEGFDLSPCGGTHVRSTSEVGLICVTAAERYKGGTRLYFHCGRRVLDDLRLRRDEGERLSSMLSAPVGAHTRAVERLQEELHQQKRRLDSLNEELAVYQAETLLREPEPLLRRILPVDKVRLRLIAQHIAKQEGRAAFLGAIEEDASGKRGVLCFAAGPGSGVDAGKKLKEVCQMLGGRGGGKPHLAEGSCPVEGLSAAIL